MRPVEFMVTFGRQRRHIPEVDEYKVNTEEIIMAEGIKNKVGFKGKFK